MTDIRVPAQAQIVIVGGGIVGASVAYHLSLRGVTDVVLLERNSLTSGTTWHAAGLVAQLRATHNMTRLAAYSGELYEQLETDGYPTGFKRTGSIAVAADHERLEELVRGADMARCFGVDVQPVSVEELASHWPLLHTDDLVGGVWVPRDGQTSPVDTTMALANAAKANGVRIIEDVEVLDLLADGDVARCVSYRDRRAGADAEPAEITADAVVTCAGLWSRHLAAKAGVSLPLHGCEHFYLVTEPVDGLPPGAPTLRDPGSNTYFKEEGNRILVGFFEPVAKPIDSTELPDKPFLELDEDWEHLAPVIESAFHRLPVLGETGIRLFFNGPESFTPDDAYLLGETPELRRHFCAAGFNSVGIQSAGGAGRVLADWIVDGHPPMDLADVDVRRFHPFQGTRRYTRDRSAETLGLLYEMHWPFRQKDTARGARRSPLHDRLVAAGACMGEATGWERPNWFAPSPSEARYSYTYRRQNWFDHAAAEHRATREAVALFDQTSFSKFEVAGRDAASALNRICANDVDVDPGTTVYGPWLNERGGIEADLTVTRLAEDRFLVVTSVATQTRDFDWLTRHLPADANVVATDVTSAYAVLGLMGPNSRAVLQQVTDADLSAGAFPFGAARRIDLGYAHAWALRLTYVGELGWELYIPTELAVHAFDALAEAGTGHGLELAGYHAMNGLRLEKAYRHWGHDITDEDTPIEAGLTFTCAFDKPRGFIGRDAVLAQQEAGVERRLVQFKLDDPEPLLYHDEPIWRDGELVGHTTSGMYGHTVGAALGMGYVSHPIDMLRSEVLEATFEIQVNGERYPATASYRPFYDPANDRIHER
ncbi:MAG: GcvT family protein [Acidimicrobiales bacterium]|nr:GcvT family protein [Acidimicrobiales bacterium]